MAQYFQATLTNASAPGNFGGVMANVAMEETSGSAGATVTIQGPDGVHTDTLVKFEGRLRRNVRVATLAVTGTVLIDISGPDEYIQFQVVKTAQLP